MKHKKKSIARLKLELPPFVPPKRVMKRAWLCRDEDGDMWIWLGPRTHIEKSAGGSWIVKQAYCPLISNSWIDVEGLDGNDCYRSYEGHLIPGPFLKPGKTRCVDIEVEEGL